MADVLMEVTQFNAAKLKVSPDRGVALKDEQPTLRWRPASNLTIKYIGFNAPVGPGQEIGVPEPDPNGSGEWIATDQNQQKDIFTYSVFALTTDGRVLSSDPQIENEGTSGGADEEEDPGGGG